MGKGREVRREGGLTSASLPTAFHHFTSNLRHRICRLYVGRRVGSTLAVGGPGSLPCSIHTRCPPRQGAPVPAASALHPLPMLSLAAVNSQEETAAWLSKTVAKLSHAVGAGSDARLVTTTIITAAADATSPNVSKTAIEDGSRGGGGRGHRRLRVRSRASQANAPAPVAKQPGRRAYSWVLEPKVDGLAVRVCTAVLGMGRMSWGR